MSSGSVASARRTFESPGLLLTEVAGLTRRVTGHNLDVPGGLRSASAPTWAEVRRLAGLRHDGDGLDDLLAVSDRIGNHQGLPDG